MQMNIGFWINSDGNARSSVKGLSFEQVEFLKSLKEGDRLVLFVKPTPEGQQPHFSLTKTGNQNG